MSQLNTLYSYIEKLDCEYIAEQLQNEGYIIFSNMLSHPYFEALHDSLYSSMDLALSPNSELVDVQGEQSFFKIPTSEILTVCRDMFYRKIMPIANQWNEILGKEFRFPDTPHDFQKLNYEIGQRKELSCLNILRRKNLIPLKNNESTTITFPFKLIGLFSSPETDFSGGEFVMVEQRPRMQSRPIVVPLEKGDVALIALSDRPVKGARGYYRANLKHAISRVRRGQRIGLEVFFHHGK
ncbi:hypothetical protein Xmau_01488 [Xenorhabdus mauleonii]|uniref:Prolyl 4-hydroxylase n=1 Tax=Xenorhabdus mauleonii TaxID=351675 RepID=A0A1I3PK29_9GAMM|nr:2OG-Fe(II) oxygenase [Xenorhabdus mauleonii]PHM44774.1 hypothetical protein Xmau_01488 [Xenorhabdus mauleonii]SFJ21843.1 hypothetical protein SAMN05421680_106173 [Xenorhabdus mauleonii]